MSDPAHRFDVVADADFGDLSPSDRAPWHAHKARKLLAYDDAPAATVHALLAIEARLDDRLAGVAEWVEEVAQRTG